MKRLPLLLAVLLVLFAAVNTSSAQTVQLTVANQFVSHDTLFFDIYIEATVSTVFLGNADFVLTFNSANFTNPVLADTDQNITGVNFALKDSLGGSIGATYEGNAISPAAITSNSLIINIQQPSFGSQTTFNNNIPKLTVGTSYKFGTYCVSGITNTAGTAGLAWKTSGAGTSCDAFTLGHANPWTGSAVTLTTPSITDANLPVELTSFTALAQGRTVNLSWATKTEINNSGFDVERQAAGVNQATSSTWAKVGNIAGKGTTNTPQSYSYSDVVKEAGTYNYRLKQINRDGGFVYSSEVTVKATLSASDYQLSQNYPNPFNPSTKFTFAMKTTEHVAVKIYNSIGQEVATLLDGVVPADEVQNVTFDASRLASGVYFYVLRAPDRLDVKKMLLMK
ncbi:MAG: T9SS type A sorting domain-containing protein [Bacteroidota bacterium]